MRSPVHKGTAHVTPGDSTASLRCLIDCILQWITLPGMLAKMPILADIPPNFEVSQNFPRETHVNWVMIAGLGVVALVAVVLAIRAFRKRRK